MAARTVNDKPETRKLLTAASARRTKGVRETISMSDLTNLKALSYRAYIADRLDRAAIAVLMERQRQISAEGWSTAHDDHHVLGELGLAAALYALPYESGMLEQDDFIGLRMLLELSFGWDLKPEPDQRKRLVKAAALILAEIERLDRAEAKDA